MNVNEQLSLYQEMYRHESEVKERVTVRAQLAISSIFVIVASASYMVRMLDLNAGRPVFLFIGLISAFSVFVVLSVFFARKAFFGNKFALIPPATELKAYHEELNDYSLTSGICGFSPGDVDKDFKEYLIDVYAQCAAHNYEVNLQRTDMVNKSYVLFLYSFVSFAGAGFFFVAFDLDVSSPRKEVLIADRYVGDKLAEIGDELGQVKLSMQDFMEGFVVSKDDHKKIPNIAERGKAPKAVALPEKPKPPVIRLAVSSSLPAEESVVEQKK